MDNLDILCMGCMKDTGHAQQCSYCGYIRGTKQAAPFLPTGSIIDGRYYLGKVLESNGDGATYMAWHIDRNSPVMVREFLPDAICSREEGREALAVLSGCDLVFADSMQSFLDLWRNLARRRGLSALFPVFDIVEANNTVYAISEHIDGVKLEEYLAKSSTGYITWEQARVLFMPVLSTLGALHNAGIIHRGISPKTLIVCRDGRIRVSGFSIWQVRSAVGELHAELFKGYAAIEQYGVDLQQGTWTDVYSLAAVLYKSLIGSAPIGAQERVVSDTLMIPARFAERLPNFVIDAMINALQVFPEERTKTIEKLRSELSGSQVSAPASTAVLPQRPSPAQVQASSPTPVPPAYSPPAAPAKKEKSSGNGLKIAIVVLMTLILSAVTVFGVYLLASPDAFDRIFRNSDGEHSSSAEEEPNKAMRTVLNFVGQSANSVVESESNKESFNFELVEKNSMEFEVGIVMKQNIDPNTQVEKGTTITLYVSIGPRQIVIPDISGLSYEDAEKQLEALGLSCEPSSKYNDGTQEGGTVAGTLPEIGSTVQEGSLVYINVWKELEDDESTTARFSSIWDLLG